MLTFCLTVITNINSTGCDFVLPCLPSKARDFQVVSHLSCNPAVTLDGMQQRYTTLCKRNLINRIFTLVEVLKYTFLKKR